MKVGIMQPYLFPYLGYFQLINIVDKFLIHDDIQYIKGGWINRNRISSNNGEYVFTLSLKRDSYKRNINERYFVDTVEEQKRKLLKVVAMSYKKAPFYNGVMDLLVSILEKDERNVAVMTTNSLKSICNYIGIRTPFYISSSLEKNNSLIGQDRVIHICKNMGANCYINLSGGIELYKKEEFLNNGIELGFIKTKRIEYKQFKRQFIPNLSILDVLMFNSKKDIKNLLNEYELI